MIIKYSDTKIEKIIEPNNNDIDKFEKKIKEATEETNPDNLVKEGSDKPFWLNK